MKFLEKFLKNKVQKMITLIEEVRKLLIASEHEGWDSSTPEHIKKVIDKNIDQLKENGTCNSDELILHFAPTSSLQELSMANGWSDEYMKLSTKFDKLIEEFG